MQNNRIYVFKDIINGKEKECSETGAITLLQQRQYLDGQARFQFLRSFIPKVVEVKKFKRKDGDKKLEFNKITKVEETDVDTRRPVMRQKLGPQGGLTYKLRTTWLEPLSQAELQEPPDLNRR